MNRTLVFTVALALAMAGGLASGATDWRRQSADLSDGRTIQRAVPSVDGIPILNATRIEVRTSDGKLAYASGPEAAEMHFVNTARLDGQDATARALGFLAKWHAEAVAGGQFAADANEPSLVGWQDASGTRVAWLVPIPVSKPTAGLVNIVVDAETGGVIRMTNAFSDGFVSLRMNVFRNTDKDLAHGKVSPRTMRGTDEFAPNFGPYNDRVSVMDQTTTGTILAPTRDFRFDPNGPDKDMFDAFNAFYHTTKAGDWFAKKRGVTDFTFPATVVVNVPGLAGSSAGFDTNGLPAVQFGDEGTAPLHTSKNKVEDVAYNDFAENPDIIYHEFAHLIYRHIIGADEFAFSEASGRNEGNSDFHAGDITKDSEIGLPNDPFETDAFFRTGLQHEVTRELEDKMFYPFTPYQDFDPQDSDTFTSTTVVSDDIGGQKLWKGPEGHHAGRLWGSTLWHARHRIGPVNGSRDAIAGLRATAAQSSMRDGMIAILNTTHHSRFARWYGVFASAGMTRKGSLLEPDEFVETPGARAPVSRSVHDETLPAQTSGPDFSVDGSTGALRVASPPLQLTSKPFRIPSAVIRPDNFPQQDSITHTFFFTAPAGSLLTIGVQRGHALKGKPLNFTDANIQSIVMTGTGVPGDPFIGSLNDVTPLVRSGKTNFFLKKFVVPTTPFQVFLLNLTGDGEGEYKVSISAK